jgi:hypothetical protein
VDWAHAVDRAFNDLERVVLSIESLDMVWFASQIELPLLVVLLAVNLAVNLILTPHGVVLLAWLLN